MPYPEDMTDGSKTGATTQPDSEQRPVCFSAKVIEHGLRPKHLARMHQPDAYGAACGWCGEVMEVFLRLAGDRIVGATFMADGCISTMACGDMIAAMVAGMTLEEAERVTPHDLITALDGLPYASVHCTELSVSALRQAIANGRKRKKEQT